MNGEDYDQMDRQVGFQDHGRDARIRILQNPEPTGQRMDGRIRILKKSDPTRQDGRIRILKKSLVPWTDCIGRNMDGRIRLLKKSDPESFGGKMDGKTRVLRKLTTDNRINTAGNPRLLRIKSRSIKK